MLLTIEVIRHKIRHKIAKGFTLLQKGQNGSKLLKKVKTGFTLVELLVVLGILAVMLALVLIAINPLEILNKTLTANNATIKELASTTSSLVATSTIFESRISALESVKPFDLKAMMATSSGLTFGGSLIVNGSLTVDSIGSATSSLSIMSDVRFFGTPYFTTDTAGFAIVKKGTKKVTVVFDKEYLEQPIVNTSISLNESTSTDQSASAVEAIFNQDIRFLITNKSKKGFTITLNKPVSEDVQFSWIALAVKGAKTFESEEIKSENQNVQNTTPVTPIINEAPKQEVNNNSTTTVNQTNTVSSSTPSSNTPAVAPETQQPVTSTTPEQASPVNTETTTQPAVEQSSTNNTTTDTAPVTTESQPTVTTPAPAVIESTPTPAEPAPAPSSSASITQ
jgi:prepilin-type N-terminal cleavage/methylation domain-containing protein